MNKLNDAIIKAATAMLIKFNNRLGRHQRESESTLKDWAQYLTIERGFTVIQIGHALNQIMSSGVTFMPSAYEIEAQLQPSLGTKEDLAPMVANEIITFIRLYHPDLESNYFKNLSETAMEVIKANGGTKTIRESENFETMKAQLERLVRSVVSSKQANDKNKQLEKIGLVIPIRKMDSIDFDPGVA